MSAEPKDPTSSYAFEGGFPTAETIERAYDDAHLNRAIQAYRFFFPTVSGLAICRGNESVGLTPNRVYGVLDTGPQQVGFTLNSDTPYSPILLDLRAGPLVIEVPQGPLIYVNLDLNQRWLGDMGMGGPDAGKGGSHLVLPPGFKDEIPDGFFVQHSTTYRVVGGARAIPVGGDMQAAADLLRQIRIRPLDPAQEWGEQRWIDLTRKAQDMTPLAWETNLEFWRVLHEVIDSEPPLDGHLALYGELAALGIEKGRPFAPDERMTGILEQAARLANAQMRVQAFADRRPERVVWPETQWEWVALRENPEFAADDDYIDVYAREKWFFQAIAVSPIMMQRSVRTRSLYWLGSRDKEGVYLDGGTTYRLTVPLSAPAKMFWSVTVYDAQSRSEIQTEDNRAALRSLFELADAAGDDSVDLFFGPEADDHPKNRWIKTSPGRGWFVYFRLYGPEEAAFDGSWRLPDFERLS